MGIKLVDEICPMGSFPVTKSQYIECADGTDLETKLSTISGGGGGSGEENTIKSISINGSPISPDENKNIDIPIVIPTTQIDNQVGRIWLA